MKKLSTLCKEFIEQTKYCLEYELEADPSSFFHAEGSTLFLVTDDGAFHTHAHASDVYELLSEPVMSTLSNVTGIAIHSCGWASPLPTDGVSPSQHPERRRVALVATVDNENMGSAIAFEDDDDIVTDDGDASGMLALALREAWENAILV